MNLQKTFKKQTNILCLALLMIWGAGIGNASAQTKATEVAEENTQAVSEDSIAVQPQLSIAVFSYEDAFNSMAELSIVNEKVNILKQQYDEELKRVEAEFNSKYEDFLKTQAKLANAIRNKRQSEVQQLLERNLAFKSEAQQTIKAQEAELLAPLKEKLQNAINTVAKDGGYNIVLNTDGNAIPFIDGIRVTDITEEIKEALK